VWVVHVNLRAFEESSYTSIRRINGDTDGDKMLGFPAGSYFVGPVIARVFAEAQ
jgi:hypothetical protein